MGSDAKERLLSMNPWVDLDWPERCKQAAARIAELEAALSAATAAREAAEAEAARLREAIHAVQDATAAYLPPDGIGAQECLNRILQATDNPTINAITLGAQYGRP